MATVRQLIEQLSKFDPELRVYFDDASYGMSEIWHAQAESAGGETIVRLTE